MTASDHDQLRDWAGAYTMGALDPDDRRTFETHLRTCTDCQHEVRQLAVLPGLLAQVDPLELDDGPDPTLAATIERRARDEVAALRVSRQRWRVVAATAAAACVVAIVALGALVLIGTGSMLQGLAGLVVATGLAALLRLVLPTRTAGWLASRSRGLDVAGFVVLAVALGGVTLLLLP